MPRQEEPDPSVLAGDQPDLLDDPGDRPVTPVCEACGVNPVTVVVTDSDTERKHQYCSGCYFNLHPTRPTVEWP